MPHDGAMPKFRLALFAFAVFALSAADVDSAEAKRAHYTDLTAQFLAVCR